MACDPVRLQAAKDAYDRLLTGQAARVIIDGNNGDRVEYVAANIQRLAAYIQSLQNECDLEASGAQPVKGPFYATF